MDGFVLNWKESTETFRDIHRGAKRDFSLLLLACYPWRGKRAYIVKNKSNPPVPGGVLYNSIEGKEVDTLVERIDFNANAP